MRRPVPIITAAVVEHGSERFIKTNGQVSRALAVLDAAGSRGVTALDVSSTWAWRFGAYVHELRHEHGLDIETVRESHPGGWHARYVLRSHVRVVFPEHCLSH